MNSTLNHYQDTVGTASIIQENQAIEPSQINLRGVQNSSKRQRSTSVIPTSPTTKRPKSLNHTTKSIEQILPPSSETFKRSARQRLLSLPKNHTVPTVIRSPPSTSADTAETLPTKPQPATPPEALLELPTKLQPTTRVREPSAELVRETRPVIPAEPPAVPPTLNAEHPPPPAQEQHPSTAIDSAELLSEGEITKRQSRHINDWIAKCHDADQESVRSNNMSEMSLADSAQSPPSELLSSNLYRNRIALPDAPRYRRYNLRQLGIELIKPSSSRITPTWIEKLTNNIASSPREDESMSTSKAVVKGLHLDILDAGTSDDIDQSNLLHSRILTGLQLQQDSRWVNIKISEGLRYAQNTLIQDPADPMAIMAIPKPARTVGYNDQSLDGVQIPYTSDQHTFTMNNKYSLYTPFLLVETRVDSSGYTVKNRMLGAASACLNVNSRVLSSAKNAVHSLILSDNLAELFVSWIDLSTDRCNYCTKLVRTFTMCGWEDFVLLRRYIHNIIGWGSGNRLYEIRAAFSEGLPPQRAGRQLIMSPPPAPAPRTASRSWQPTPQLPSRQSTPMQEVSLIGGLPPSLSLPYVAQQMPASQTAYISGALFPEQQVSRPPTPRQQAPIVPSQPTFRPQPSTPYARPPRQFPNQLLQYSNHDYGAGQL
ncbi:hypothetical protein F5Y02DRAFT_384479 [Annulohypoxylon stygium]|nr:hypothetical protein F5Y02DRAFT_384479 [Annulohypoxylon stygium]